MRSFRSSLLILGLLVGFSLANSATFLKGRVIEGESGKPVSNAIFYIEEIGRHVYSDDAGYFEFPNIKPGKYSVQVARVGYETILQQIDVTPEGTELYVFKLKSSPFMVEDIVVTEQRSGLPGQTEVYAREIHEQNPKDVGEFFKTQNGFSAIRRGGYAIDPVMRSFKYEQLNVQFDGGTRVSHACPNRMDPVMTHIQTEDLEKIEIIKGPYTVRYGQTLGGVVNLVMKRPKQSEKFTLHSEVESGYERNGDGKRTRAAITAGSSFYDIYLSGGNKTFGNYKNGSGQKVPSSFRVNDYSAKIGLNPAKNQRVQLSWRQSFTRDVLHAGLPMDTKEDNTILWSADYGAQNLGAGLMSITAKIYGSNVDHIMENSRRPNYRMVHAISNVESHSLGGKIELGLNVFAKNIWHLGVDAALLKKDGTRDREVLMNACTGMMLTPSKSFVDAVWQDSRLNDIGVFSEWRQSLSPKLIAVAGLRGDFISTEINAPATQFVENYGDFRKSDEFNFSATVSLNYQLNAATTLQFSAGRGTRTANLTERYINHLTVGSDAYEYFGNPLLKPEINNQADLSISRNIGQTVLKANVFYSLLNDYITAAVDPNLPRLFLPCKEPKFTKRFQNIDRARQLGFEIQLTGKALHFFNYSAAIAHTRADNLDWNEPLPEIPPLEGKLSLRYTQPAQQMWIELNSRLVAAQQRISPSFDEGESPGFAVFNLQTALKLNRFVEINAAVLNLFDKNYYEHLNRSYRNMPEQEILYEPGRNFTFLLKLNY